MRRWLRFAPLCLLGLIVASAAHAATPRANKEDEPSRWARVAGWRQPDGLLQDTLYAILRTRDGYLWLGTRSGLSRFDGMRFTNFDARDPSVLRENEIQALAEARDGSVWVGTYGGGASRYQDGKFTVFTAQEGLCSDFVVALCTMSDGSVWLGMDGGLSRYQNGRFTNYRIADGLAFANVRALYADNDGSLWICTKPYGLHRFNHGRITREKIPGLPNDLMVEGLARDRAGNLWLATMDGLFREAPNGTTTHLTTANGLPTNQIGRSVYASPDSSMWFASDAGLVHVRDGEVHGVPVEARSPTPELVHVVLGDDEGNLWVSLAGKGLVQMRERLFFTYTTDDGLAGQMVDAIVEDAQHRVWLGTNSGLSVRENGVFRSLPNIGLPPSVTVPTLLADREGRLWVGTVLGLFRGSIDRVAAGDPNALTEIKVEGQPFIHAKWLFEDRHGTIWVATDVDGLVRIDGDRVGRLTTKDGLAHDNVLGLSEDREGALWIGTRAGLNCYKDGHFTVYRHRDGLAIDAVEATYRDRDDTLWIATRHGLTRLKDGKFTTYTANDGLFADFVHSLVEDNVGYLWMASDRGPFRVAKAELDEFARGQRRTIDCQAFGIEDGLLSTDCVGGYSPSTACTSDGTIWFGTTEGVSVVHPTTLQRNEVPPPVHIERVSIDSRAIDPRQAWVAPPGRGDLEFHYSALCLVAPEKVVYRYRLEGYDRNWVDAGDRAAAYYSNLPPGKYRFSVMGANNDGVWNRRGATFAFELEPHFYQTRWFLIGVIAAIVGSGLGVHQLQTRRLRAQREVLARHVAERTAANARLRAEVAERQNAERALRVSEERYRSFFDEDLAGACIASPNGQIIACNPAFARMFGFEQPSGVIGLPLVDLYRSADEWIEMLGRLARERKVHDYAVKLKRRDGSPIDAVASLIANVDDDGALLQIKGYLIDVTDRNQLEAQLRQAQKMEAVGRLAGGIAHDFNNLLTGIIGYSQLLLQDPQLNRDSIIAAQEIFNAGKLAAVLTRQLLTFSRRQIVQPQVLDLNVTVSELKKMLQRLIGEDIQLRLNLSPQPVLIRADPGQMEQIVMNLAVNARDAMRRGGSLTISTDHVAVDNGSGPRPADLAPGNYVKLVVRDTGCGMSPDVQARLFEPFFTTKPVGQGTGLGLSTVLGIVRQNKGGITVESAPGAGATFHIWLPVATEPVDAAGHVDGASPVRKFARVLVVEDNELVRDTAAEILRREGYDVISASNANDAVRLVSSATFLPDLVLTDVVMPDRNGRDLADELARLRPHLRVVFMSGYTDDAMMRYGLETHRQFVEKPFTAESLLRKLQDALGE